MHIDTIRSVQGDWESRNNISFMSQISQIHFCSECQGTIRNLDYRHFLCTWGKPPANTKSLATFSNALFQGLCPKGCQVTLPASIEHEFSQNTRKLTSDHHCGPKKQTCIIIAIPIPYYSNFLATFYTLNEKEKD